MNIEEKDGRREVLPTIRIGVFLTCYNRKEKTLACIHSLARDSEGFHLQFVLTDDNSTDGTIDALQELPYHLTLLTGDGSLFWNGGMRRALAYGLTHLEEYDYIMLVNDDVVFYPGIVKDLYERLLYHEGEIVVGSTVNQEGVMTYGGVQKESDIFAKYSLQEPTEEPVFCDTFNCNCIFMSKEIFEKAGNLDSHYVHSMGDYDYGLGMKAKGIRIINSQAHVGCCDDNGVAESWRDTSLSRKQRLKRKEGPKGLPRHDWYYYLKKNYGFWTAVYHSMTPYLRILLKR